MYQYTNSWGGYIQLQNFTLMTGDAIGQFYILGNTAIDDSLEGYQQV